jgi:hypothetical protein
MLTVLNFIWPFVVLAAEKLYDHLYAKRQYKKDNPSKADQSNEE